MGSVTIRNLDDDVIARLKARAQAGNRSLEAELREILARAAAQPARLSALRAEAERIRDMTPDVPQTDSATLIREDRDR